MGRRPGPWVMVHGADSLRVVEIKMDGSELMKKEGVSRF
jgi:hypothetical protein